MGNRKFNKAEKAKVKLKGTKLKSAQNITKTDFKVRKIVIPEQLKNVQVKEAGIRKTHSITDCLARLKNSTSAEAISNLKDIIHYQPDDFHKHIEQIVKIVANFSLSIEKSDRKECFKILDIICAQTTEQVFQPFFPILVTFLKCAMTHIKPAIQEDSLLILDILLKHSPQLVAAEKDNILPPYLDMVSKMRVGDKPERTLTLQLGNKITGTRWRKSVLERLIAFLKCIGSKERQVDHVDEPEETREIIVGEKVELFGKIYNNSLVDKHFYDQIPLSSIELNLKSTTAEPLANELKVTKYADMIMPLMFETWMELKPKQSKTIDGGLCAQVSHDDALMLRIVMDVMMELIKMVSESNEEIRLKFLKKNQEKFDSHLLSSFPYTQEDASVKSQESGGGKCLYQNLSIVILYLSYSSMNRQRFWKYRAKIFQFVEDCITNWKPKDQEFHRLVKKVIRNLFTPEIRSIFPNETKEIFTQLVRKCNVDQSTYDPKLALVCEIIEGSKKDTVYTEIVPQMVQVLSQREMVPVHIIRTVTALSKQGNLLVFESLDSSITEIVKNLLGPLKVTGSLSIDAEKWKREIANLVFWVRNEKILRNLKMLLKDDPLSKYISEIIDMKN